jgi:glycosyltransferase involved in cell wall biosynthesis
MQVHKKVWIISEVYYPDEQGGGHFMTKLAEGLAHIYSVHVICGFSRSDNDQPGLLKNEMHNNVHIERCYSTKFDKKRLLLRLINFVTVSISIFIKSLSNISNGDLVIVVTTPPSLPFVIAIVCKLVRAKCILRIEDIYPETLIATGITGSHSIVARFLSFLNKWLYNSVDQITVLGRDMERLVIEKLGRNSRENYVTIIPNWADLDLITPGIKSSSPLINELGLINKFVVQCSGNMGRAQGIENIFRAAELLQDRLGIHFLFIGTGVKREWMKKTVQDKHLKNITILGQQPRIDQPNFLNACDIAIVSLISGMKGAAVPSRLYNIMAAGKPVIAITEEDSEVSLVIKEEQIGWVAPPDEPEKLVDIILEAYSNPEQLKHWGLRARLIAENKYTYSKGIESYHKVIENLPTGKER